MDASSVVPTRPAGLLGAVEVLSAIIRRCPMDDAQAKAALREVATDREGFYEVSMTPQILSTAENLVQRHRLRCADAIHLASAILAREELREPLCLIASDVELLNAARTEGFVTLDPQTHPALPPPSA